MNKPHKHAEVIKAWADGAEIEYRSEYTRFSWVPAPHPIFDSSFEYRVKPEIPDGYILWKQSFSESWVNDEEPAGYWCISDDGRHEYVEAGDGFPSFGNHKFYCFRADYPEKIVRWQWVIQSAQGLNSLSISFYTEEEIYKELNMSNYKVICKAEWTRMEFAE